MQIVNKVTFVQKDWSLKNGQIRPQTDLKVVQKSVWKIFLKREKLLKLDLDDWDQNQEK